MALEECRIKNEEGCDVYMVGCDSTVGICHYNPMGDKCKCMFCKYTMRRFIKQLTRLNDRYHYIPISSLVSKDMIEEAEKTIFNYSNVKELKQLTYKQIDIGYGAFSTYATATRNIMPSFNDALHDYLDYEMRSEIRETLAIDKIINKIQPNLLIFHNGRFNNLKPWLCATRKYGIDFIVTETKPSLERVMTKDNFFNESPHSFDAIRKKILKAWENCGDKGEEIGRLFFENKRNAKPAGDKVYTGNQIVGKLPDGFDKSKRNIAIFNSSEDEFFAISKEYDDSVLFENQYEGLKRIFEHYKDRTDIHFYLRIHPNLKYVRSKSHTNLYKLNYQNVTIIPPDSMISSYALMDSSEKIIVFGSTMGVESTYWGKPVINLVKTYYSKMDVVYEPQTEEELFSLIDTIDLLPPGERVDLLKVACYCMCYHTEPFKYYHNKFYDWHGTIYPMKTLLGSSKLYRVMELIIDKLTPYHGYGRRFNNICQRTM